MSLPRNSENIFVYEFKLSHPEILPLIAREYSESIMLIYTGTTKYENWSATITIIEIASPPDRREGISGWSRKDIRSRF
jgi:hypothetical protein